MPPPAPLLPCQATASHPTTSIPPLFLSTPPSSSSRTSTALTSQLNGGVPSRTITCALSSSRRQTRPKKNHLRSKQLSRNVPPGLLDPPPPQPSDSSLLDELAGRVSVEVAAESVHLVPLLVGEDDVLLTMEEENEREDEQVPVMEPVVLPRTEVGNASYPEAAAATKFIVGPKLLMELALYIGLLLAVQTVCDLFFFGGEVLDTKDEAVADRSRRNKKTGPTTWWGGVEKEQEIHRGIQMGIDESELASKVAEIRAMAREARVTEANGAAQGGEETVGITGDVKQEVTRRLKRLAKGAVQVVMHKDRSIKSKTADETAEPSFRRKMETGRYREALNRKTPKGFNGTAKKVPKGVTTDTKVDRSKRHIKAAADRITLGGLETPVVSQVRPIDSSLAEKGDTTRINRNPLGDTSKKESGKKKLQDHHGNWWLKLPYVLGIYLRRTSGGKKYRGLYTLKINSHHVGSYLSVTIVFENRGDATNLCYIIESYFKELGDARVDIVPITTQELAGAIEEKSLNAVVVVRKGQLRLFADQSLSEVETQLQSIVDQNLKQEFRGE